MIHLTSHHRYHHRNRQLVAFREYEANNWPKLAIMRLVFSCARLIRLWINSWNAFSATNRVNKSTLLLASLQLLIFSITAVHSDWLCSLRSSATWQIIELSADSAWQSADDTCLLVSRYTRMETLLWRAAIKCARTCIKVDNFHWDW